MILVNPQNMDEPEQAVDEEDDGDNSPSADSQEDEAEDDDGRASPVDHSRPRNDSHLHKATWQASPRASPGPPKTSTKHPDQQRPGISPHSKPSLNTQPPQPQPSGVLTRTAPLPLDNGKWTSRAGRATHMRSKGRNKPTSFSAEVMPDKMTSCFLFVNFLFVVVGSLVIALVVTTIFKKNDYSMLFRFDLGEEDNIGFIRSVGVAALTTGTAIVLLCFLGCLGVVLRNTTILSIYINCVIGLIVLQVVAVAIAFFYGNAVAKKIGGTLLQELAKHYDGQLDSNNSFSKAFDYAQVFLGCCGVTSYTDFKKTPWYKEANKIRNVTANDGNATPHEVHKFPPTCCRLKDKQQFLADLAAGGDVSATFYDPNCLTRVPSRDNEYTGWSCLEAFKLFVSDKSKTIVLMTVVVVCLQASGVVSAMGVERNIEMCLARLRMGQYGVYT